MAMISVVTTTRNRIAPHGDCYENTDTWRAQSARRPWPYRSVRGRPPYWIVLGYLLEKCVPIVENLGASHCELLFLHAKMIDARLKLLIHVVVLCVPLLSADEHNHIVSEPVAPPIYRPMECTGLYAYLLPFRQALIYYKCQHHRNCKLWKFIRLYNINLLYNILLPI